MDFSPSPAQQAIVDAVAKACRPFDDDYWSQRDRDGEFPHDFHRAMADAGVLGLTMPEEHGGSGLGIVEATLVMHEVARSSGAQSAASAIHINIFGPHPILEFGTDEQRAAIR